MTVKRPTRKQENHIYENITHKGLAEPQCELYEIKISTSKHITESNMIIPAGKKGECMLDECSDASFFTEACENVPKDLIPGIHAIITFGGQRKLAVGIQNRLNEDKASGADSTMSRSPE